MFGKCTYNPKMRILVSVFLFSFVVFGNPETYRGWKSYFVNILRTSQNSAFEQIVDDHRVVLLYQPAVSREGLVLVSPEHQPSFINTMEEEGVIYKVHSENVEENLKYDDMLRTKKAARTWYSDEFAKVPFYMNYLELEEIEKYLVEIANKYPTMVTLKTPANSFEGRPIQYLKISHPPSSKLPVVEKKKPIVFINGGVHGKEWISPPVVLWAIKILVENNSDHDLLKKFDWIVLPIVNPDGYKFTFASNRFWSKTRSINKHPDSEFCPGVDIDRNFDFEWNSIITNNNLCDDTYPGTEPFTEIETQVVRDIIEQGHHRIMLYLTIRSYGSMIMYPWGHDGSKSTNSGPLHAVGVAMAEAINAESSKAFPRYKVNNSFVLLGRGVDGSAKDYAHAVGVPFSYNIRLPGLSIGSEGFHLDPAHILQVCQETWQGIAMAARTASVYYD